MKGGRSKEVLIDTLDPAKWVTIEKTGGFRIYKFWEDANTGASICLLDVPPGGTIPIRHQHASNQFMYCIEGEYEYLEPKPGLVLKPGSFYMNPKDNPHGPTVARTRCVLLEIYDGPHYYKTPSFHTANTVGRIAGEGGAKKKTVGKTSKKAVAKAPVKRKTVAKRVPTGTKANATKARATGSAKKAAKRR